MALPDLVILLIDSVMALLSSGLQIVDSFPNMVTMNGIEADSDPCQPD